MDVPDPGREPEQLAGGDGPRVRWTAVAVVAVLAVGGIALAQAAHHDPRRTAKHSASAHRQRISEPAPAPVATDSTPVVHVGSVFLEHLPGCTRTDHRHRLSVALGVTNLSAASLQLLGVTPVSSNAVLVQPVRFRVGRAGCARPQIARPVRLGPADNAVVEIDFRVGAACPSNTLVSATVAFDGGSSGILHASSSELANLDKLGFDQCG